MKKFSNLEYYILKNFMICTVYYYCQDSEINEVMRDRARHERQAMLQNLVGKPLTKWPHGRLRRGWERNPKIEFREIDLEKRRWTQTVQSHVLLWVLIPVMLRLPLGYAATVLMNTDHWKRCNHYVGHISYAQNVIWLLKKINTLF